MPNGGPDHCGHCNFNENQGDNVKGFCKMRGINITRPFWTYCANQQRHTNFKTPLGPVFASGLNEMTRIPWLGDREPQETASGVCIHCSQPYRHGILMDINIGFCSDKHYIKYWKSINPLIKLYNCNDHPRCSFASLREFDDQ